METSACDELEKMLHDSNATPMSIPLAFLKDITCDFSPESILGQGGFAVVYKGILRSGKIIAVKKLFEIHLNEESFQKEVSCLMGIKHQNVVQFLGYCAESSWQAIELPSGSGKYIFAETLNRLLCFEYVSNKSLGKHISVESLGLEWNLRYKIIKGICSGLHFLHEECRMVHMDLKPENILMESTLIPKIADFGLSRIFSNQQSRIITDNRAGTCGYMAPEYLIRGVISKKADIFSLGVIVLEIITGGRDYPYFQEDSLHSTTDKSFQQFTEKVHENWRNQFVSTPKYKSVEKYIQQVILCVDIALKCVDPHMDKRPTAKDIIQELNSIDQVEDPEELLLDVHGIEKLLVLNTAASKDLTHPSITEDMFKNETHGKIAEEATSEGLSPVSWSKLSTGNPSYHEAVKKFDEQQSASDTTAEVIASCGLLDVYPLKLCFPVEPNKLIPCSLHLTNNENKQVVFRLMEMEKRYNPQYTLKLPLYNILPARSRYTLVVTLATGKMENIPRKGEVDLVLQTVIVDGYIRPLGDGFDCDRYFEKAEKANMMHMMSLKAIYDPQGKTSSELAKPPSTQIISMENTFGEIMFSLDMNRTEPWIITGQPFGHIHMWNYDTRKSIGSVQHGDTVSAVKFIERKKWFIAGLIDGLICVYNYENGVQKITDFRGEGNGCGINSLDVHATQPYALSSCGEYIQLWDWDKDWECIQTFEESHGASQLAFNPNDISSFASASGDHTVKLWSIYSVKPIYSLRGHSSHVNCLDFFTRDGRQYLITGSSDKTARVWDLQRKTSIYKLGGFLSSVTSVISHPNLPLFITGTTEGAIHLHSATDYRLKRIVDINGYGGVHRLACLMESRRIVIGTDRAISIMEIHDE